MDPRGLLLLTICAAASGQTLSAGPSCMLATGFDLRAGCNKASAIAEPLSPCKDAYDRGPCIQSEPKTMETAYTRKVDNSEDYSSMLSTVVSAEGGGFGFSVSASASYMSESGTSDRSVSYFLGQSGTVREESVRGDMKVSPEALELLKMCNSASDCAFVETYGLHYIYQITYGRSFLGSFTMWDHSTSKSTSLDVMAKFSANDVFYKASGSAEFDTARSQQEGHLETKANAKWLGGLGLTLDGSSPDGMYKSFMRWNATSVDNPAPMTMTFRNWIDLKEVQNVINTKSQEVKDLFSPKEIVSATTERITMELGKTMYSLNAIYHALAWSCVKQQADFRNNVISLEEHLTTHLTRIQSADEALVLELQAQILSGNYSFFRLADQALDDYNEAVNKYFPNGFCGVCVDEYKCGATGCCQDPEFPVCCPAFPGMTTKDLCLPKDSVCCTDRWGCWSGDHCVQQKACCPDPADIPCGPEDDEGYINGHCPKGTTCCTTCLHGDYGCQHHNANSLDVRINSPPVTALLANTSSKFVKRTFV